MQPKLLASVTTATMLVRSGDLLDVMVIVTVFAVLVWMVRLAQNWSFVAMMWLELVIMSVVLVGSAVLAYVVLKWKPQENRMITQPQLQQINESTNHAALSHQAASGTAAPLSHGATS